MLGSGRGCQKLIETILCDGTRHQLSPQVLDIMLDYDRVRQFRRSGGWATVGVDPIRARHIHRVGIDEDLPERRTLVDYCPRR